MGSIVMQLCDREACTGCEACRNACPQNCITMVQDAKGFLCPEIDYSCCKECGQCRNVCPVLVQQTVSFQRSDNPDVYAAWATDDSIRERSSSGGLFSIIAENILEKGGVVFGAAFDDNMHLHHLAVTNIDEIDQLRRSKYVQSEIGDAYRQVKQHLEQGKRVFFVGAPCQVAGLNLFLGTDNENLITADFICHGVPSPKVFSNYISYIENIYGCRIRELNFRDKRKGWSNGTFVLATIESGKQIILRGKHNSFMYGFLKNVFLRNSCYDCQFRVVPRQSDFTIADFWGIEEKYPQEAHKGISCLMVNSDKGQIEFKQWNSNLFFSQVPFSLIKKSIYCSINKSQDHKSFFNDIDTSSFKQLIQKYLTPPMSYRIRMFIKSHLGLKSIIFVAKLKRLICR